MWKSHTAGGARLGPSTDQSARKTHQVNTRGQRNQEHRDWAISRRRVQTLLCVIPNQGTSRRQSVQPPDLWRKRESPQQEGVIGSPSRAPCVAESPVLALLPCARLSNLCMQLLSGPTLHLSNTISICQCPECNFADKSTQVLHSSRNNKPKWVRLRQRAQSAGEEHPGVSTHARC